MGFNGKHNNGADGRDPDFGAIFMSNSGTKRECFKRRLFGLPSSEIQFVEQVKAGMILFLFEYEKRQLHGVFKASCDGAINIVPNAFTSSGMQFPAQVKFTLIWHCKPLPECLFRDAIRENYFSANKFNFGLSEKQVYKLLRLFSMRKLELKVPRPTVSGGYSKRPSYKIRVDGDDSLSVSDRLICEDLRKNGQRIVFSDDSPGLHHSNGDDSLSVSDRLMCEDPRKNGQRMVFSDDSPGLHHSNVNPSEFHSEPFLECNYLVRNQIRPTSPMIHPIQAQILNNSCATQGDASSKNTLLYDPDAPDLNISKSSFVWINNGSRSELGSASPSNNLRWNSSSNQPCLMQTELQDMNRCHHVGYGFPNRGAYGSNRDCMPFNETWNSDQLAAESVAYGAGNGIPSLKSSSAPVSSPNIGGRVHEPFSSFFHNYKSCVDNDAHPIALRQNLGHEMTLQKNNETFSPDIGGRVREPFSSLFHNYKSCVDNDAYAVALRQNLGHEMTLQKNNETFSPDIGGRVRDPFSSLFHNYKSCVDNDTHPVTLRQNLGLEMLQKNNEMFTPVVPWANEGHFSDEYRDPSIHEYDIESYGNLKNNNSGYPKRKSSVFSRLSYVRDVSKQENGNNARNEEHNFDNSVDEVMEMVHQSHSQWLTKRKPKPLVKRNKAEILRDKTKIIGSSMKSDCLENTLENVSTDFTTASECNTNGTVEETCFVDFKRRSKVRKCNDENEIRSSNDSEKSENLVRVSQKRRKLIRPNFRKSTTSDDKGIDLGVSQNLEVPSCHESHNLKDVSESCCSLVHTEDNIKTDVEVRNFISQKHFEDKSSSHARGYVCNEGGKARDGALTALGGGSECLENTNNQNAFSPASCNDNSCHIKNLESLLSICREHYVGRRVNSKEGVSKDGRSSTIEVKDGSDCSQKSGNEIAPIETYCHIKEGLGVDRIKLASKDTESIPSICQEHQVDKVIRAGRDINTEKAMSEDGGSSFTA